MKKLSLLILLLTIAASALAQYPEAEVYGGLHRIYQRLDRGSAIVDYTSAVPQDGVFEIVYTQPPEQDSEMYAFVKNIVYGSEREFGDYWVEAYISDDLLYVPLNQVIAEEYTRGHLRTALLVWGSVTFDATTGHSRFVRDTQVQAATYAIDDNKILIEGTSGPVVIDMDEEHTFSSHGLGIIWVDEGDSENYEWAGYCEWSTEISTDIYVIDWQPEGELKVYNRTGDCFHSYEYGLNRATEPTYFNYEQLSDKSEIVYSYDSPTVYLKDPLLSQDYGTWVMGSLSEDGQYIKVNLPQYVNVIVNQPVSVTIGYSMMNNSVRPDGTFGDWLSVNEYYDYRQVWYSVSENTITMLNTYTTPDLPYPANYNADGLVSFDKYHHVDVLEANIVYTLDSETPVEKTANPVINGYAMENGEVYCVEITPSEPSTIYYRMHNPDGSVTTWKRYNDTPLTFDVPGDYRIEAYAQANGKSSSEIVYHDFKVNSHTGVSETPASKQIVNRRYFNAMGQEVQYIQGMTIIVTTYSDGTTTSVKLMK